MPLTQQQSLAAFAPHSVVVTAGAGTGKTYMLAERYVFHLQQGLSPLEIVAVTFTEKAAAELRSRIRSLVAQKFPLQPDLLAELEAAQISTIHALASRICREHPEVAKVPPDFKVLEESEGNLWLKEQFLNALDRLPQELSQVIPFSLLSQILNQLLEDPTAAEAAFNQNPDQWEKWTKEYREKALNDLLSHPDWQAAKGIIESYQGNGDDRLELESRQVAVKAMSAIEVSQDINASLATLKGLKINFGSQKNWGGKENLDLVKDAINRIRDLAKIALNQGLITLELTDVDQQIAAKLPILQEAFNFIQDQLQATKNQARVLTFADLETQALEALKSPSVQAYYHQRWQAILVDEFQDTNSIQGQLLEHLSQKAKMTLVGDIKQSIYGFRRADITVFQAWQDKIIAEGGLTISLSESFRTHQALLEPINQIFAPLFLELHQDLTATRPSPVHGLPEIELYTLESKKNPKAQCQRVEAHYIAEKIQELLTTQTPIHDKITGESRPTLPQDIAILSRTWDALEIYNEALMGLGIPTALGGGGNLLETREAKDGLALLRFLADPGDDIALVAVLRSPWFAKSDRLLFHLAQTLETSWWETLCQTEHPELSPVVETLNHLLERRSSEPPSRLLQWGDRLTGYSAICQNLPGSNRREADWRGFIALIRQLETGHQDLFQVVRRLKRLLAAEVEIPRLPLAGHTGVALMTIHAAKGLEWPVVIVADLTRQQPKRTENFYFDPSLGVSWMENTAEKPVLHRILADRQQQRENQEQIRLYYVAFTRSRDRLILTANDTAGGALSQLQPGFHAANVPIQPRPYQAEFAQLPSPPDAPLTPISRPFCLSPVGSGIFELPVTALSEYKRCPRRFQYRFVEGHPGMGEGVAIGQRIGSLTHLALEQGIFDPQHLNQFDPSLPLETVQEAVELARRFTTHPEFRFYHQSAIATEQPITLSFPSLTFYGRVDLIGPDWILDYKTDQDFSPEIHNLQLWAYSKATHSSTAHIAYLRHGKVHTFTAQKLAAAETEALQLIQKILAGEFIPQPFKDACQSCHYQGICRYALETLSDD